jgi:hypothetical protein
MMTISTNEPGTSPVPSRPTLSPADREALRRAHRHLEYPSYAARLTGRLGRPIEKFFKALPESWHDSFQDSVRASLERTLSVAIFSLGREGPPRRRYHKALGMLSGAAAGMFGLPAVLAELPVTTGLMLRSIAAIARTEGEDLSDPDARLACMEVFALGGRSSDDDAADVGYYGMRLALAMHFTRVSEAVVSRGIVRWNPPGLVRFIAEVAARFGVVVTEKAALQMVPLLGAGTGGLLNLIFMEHFQDIARAHFTMRRLERTYGAELMRAEYDKLSRADRDRLAIAR